MAGGKKYGVYLGPKVAARKNVARKAVKRLNNQLGAGVVRIVKNKSKADAVVRSGGVPKGFGGYTYSGTGGRKDIIKLRASAVNASTPLARGATRRLLEHEIGHGLGLGHKTAPMNLMNPNSGMSRLNKKQKATVRKTKRTGGYK